MAEENSIESKIAPLGEASKSWHDLPAQKKLEYLIAIQRGLEENLPEWGKAASEVRSIDHATTGGGFLTTAVCSGVISYLVGNYQTIVKTGKSWTPPVRKTASGQTAYSIFPNGFVESTLAQGSIGEVFVTQEGQFLPTEQEAGVCAILAPGNFEGPNDILHKMFVENKVAVWKPHAVNQKATLPFVQKAFAPLIKDGFLVVIEDSSPEAGAKILSSPVITEALMTGGALTFDRIVWGPPEEQAKNKQTGQKHFSKKFDAELGAVSPVIVFPGIWTDVELETHATIIAVAKLSNGGAICASPQVIIMDEDWPQREKFVTMIKEKLKTVPSNGTYYPGAEERQKKAASTAKNAEIIENNTKGSVAFLNDLTEDCSFLRDECFALALGYALVKADNDAKKFADLASDFANNKLFGTLSCSVICPHDAEKAMGGSDYVTEKLNYGAIGFNLFGVQLFIFQCLPWGAFPGHKDTDIQSGMGKVNNPYCLSHPVKSVLKGPFISQAQLKPPKKGGNALEMERFAYFQLNPGFLRLGKLISASLFSW